MPHSKNEARCTCLPRRSFPGWLAWVKYVSSFFFGNEAMSINQWNADNNVNITCEEEYSEADNCLFETGTDVLDYYSFNEVGVISQITTTNFYSIDQYVRTVRHQSSLGILKSLVSRHLRLVKSSKI